jgi:hypothetical protein
MKRQMLMMVAATAAAAVAAALVQPASAQAATTASVDGCTVTTSTPYIRWYSGVKFVQAEMLVYCKSTRAGTVHMSLRESDYWDADDEVRKSSVNFIIAGGTWQSFTITGRCSGWDPFGSELFYAQAFLSMSVGYGQSGWAVTKTLSADC